MLVARSAFVGFRFPPDVIVLAVRWYLRLGLSYRDIEELPAERGVEVDPVTIRVVIARRKVIVEPFLIVGMVAAIRRLIVISAEAENLLGRPSSAT